MFVIIGYVVAFGCIFGVYVGHGGNITVILKALPFETITILGGALGNGLDRAFRGYVVDFLDFHVRGWHWPAFNVADMAIVCGAALLIYSAFRQPASAQKGGTP